jgi:hypothetical protein
MDGHGDDRMVEARIGHARHGEQQASGKEWRVVHRLPNAPARVWFASLVTVIVRPYVAGTRQKEIFQ